LLGKVYNGRMNEEGDMVQGIVQEILALKDEE
jgi:hypothetical protein